MDFKLKKLAKEKGISLEESEDEYSTSKLVGGPKIDIENTEDDDCGSEIDTVPDLGIHGKSKKGNSPLKNNES